VCDNCPNDPNADQTDGDDDGVGDVCDVCPGGDDNIDSEGDGIPDDCDTESVHNITQNTHFYTIQAAINAAANDDDEIEVDPGTYLEAIDFNGKAINLHSSDSDDPNTVAATIIFTTTDSTDVVTCNNGEDPNTIISGFTLISSGNGSKGMYNVSSSPTVTNCTLSENDDFGMYNLNGSPTVTNCTLNGNTHGMFNINGSNPIVTNCTMSGNTNGMANNAGSSPTVTNCTMSGNTNGMRNDDSDSNPTVTNCILWGNVTEIDNSGSSPTVTYSLVAGGYMGAGNIDADPLFIDAGNDDFRLTSASPCIDAGNNSAVPAGVTTDLAGRLRFVDDLLTADTGNGGPPTVDMGAYEYACTGNLDNIASTILPDFALFALNWMETDCGNCNGADFTDDNNVTLEDLLIQLANWLCGTGP